MKNLTSAFLLLIVVTFSSMGFSPNDDYTNESISKISGAYLEGKLDFENPVMVDVDKDGDFNSDLARKIINDQKYTNITEQIITLGTPFWGSKLATYLNDKEKFQLQNR